MLDVGFLFPTALANKLYALFCCLRWDEHHNLKFHSESVKIIFFAIYTTVNQLGERASILQNRDVRKRIIELVSSMCDPLIMNCIMLHTVS